MAVHRGMSLADRLDHYSVPEAMTSCSLWQAHVGHFGYGILKWKGKNRAAHKLAWQEARGPVPAGLFVCHRCDTPACINIDHLFLGTPTENNADRDEKGRQRHLVGEALPQAKLTAANVLAIRTSTARGIDLAARYGVRPSTICLARKGRNWAHLVPNAIPLHPEVIRETGKPKRAQA